MQLPIPKRSKAAVGAALAVLMLAGCGTASTPTQSSTPTPTPATPSQQACDDAAELRSSLEALTEVKPLEDGVPAVKTAIDDVRTDLTAAEASASDALRPSVDQVKVAFGDLQTAAAGLTPENRREKAPEIVAALAQVRTTTQAFATTVRERCPGR